MKKTYPLVMLLAAGATIATAASVAAQTASRPPATPTWVTVSRGLAPATPRPVVQPMPANPLYLGYEARALCRVSTTNGLAFGTVRGGGCSIKVQDREEMATPYQVLAAGAQPPQWRLLSGGGTPSGVYREGRDVGVCRVVSTTAPGEPPNMLPGITVLDGTFMCQSTRDGRGSSAFAQDLLIADARQVAWRAAADGSVPADAWAAGAEAVAPCRATVSGGIFFGRAGGGVCRVAVGDREVAVPQFDVLTGAPRSLSWGTAGTAVPANAFAAGTSTSGRPAHVCSVVRREAWGMARYLGTVEQGGCRVGMGGRVELAASFEILLAAPDLASRWIHVREAASPPKVIFGGQEQGKLTAVCRVAQPTYTVAGGVAGLGCHVAVTLQGRSQAIGSGHDFHFLTGDATKFSWVRHTAAQAAPPPGAFEVGIVPQRSYACRAQVGNDVLLGSLQGGKCYIVRSSSPDSNVIQPSSFEVLVARP